VALPSLAAHPFGLHHLCFPSLEAAGFFFVLFAVYSGIFPFYEFVYVW
jgi:hypothetical protein